MFAYCGNNPPRRRDTRGDDWEDILNEKLDMLEKCVDVCESVGQKYDLCISQGFAGNASMAFFDDVQSIAVVFDTKGNIAIQGQPFTKGITTGGAAPSASFVATTTVTFAPSYEKLEGMGYRMGGSCFSNYYGLGVGLDVNFCQDPNTKKVYYGLTASAGIGVPSFETHIIRGNTYTIKQYNFFTMIRNGIKAIRRKIK